MKIKDMFPSKYMNGNDLGGKSWSFKIASIKFEEMHDKQNNAKIKKPVVYFSGPKKGLILNRTIAEQIMQATGQDDTDNWSGHVVTIYPTVVRAFGADHTVIRVRRSDNGPSETPETLAHDDDELSELQEEIEQ